VAPRVPRNYLFWCTASLSVRKPVPWQHTVILWPIRAFGDCHGVAEGRYSRVWIAPEQFAHTPLTARLLYVHHKINKNPRLCPIAILVR